MAAPAAAAPSPLRIWKQTPQKNSRKCYTFCRFHTLRPSSRVLWQGGMTCSRHHRARYDFEHFTPEQESFVDSVVRTTPTKLEEVGLGDKCNVMSYLLHWFYSAIMLFPVNSDFCGVLPAHRQCHMDRKLCVLTSIVVFNTIFAWRTHMMIICVLHMVHPENRK